MKVFRALTDDEIYGTGSPANAAAGPISLDDLIARYRELRDRHIAETEALIKRDRSAILRMAGNIAGGFFANPKFESDTVVAERAVELARAIVAKVDEVPE